MKKKITVEEHRKGLIDLYKDQLEHNSDTTFMKAVLVKAIQLLERTYSAPKKIERWVVSQDKISMSLYAFSLKKK